MSAKAVKMRILRLPGLMGCATLSSISALEALKLGVALGRDLAHLAEQLDQRDAVVFKVVPPGREVHVRQADLDLAADRSGLDVGIVLVSCIDVDVLEVTSASVEAAGALDRGVWSVASTSRLDPGQRETEGLDGAFQPLEQVHRHQGDAGSARGRSA